MTILNVWVKPDIALIGTDTEIIGTDGAVGHVSKLIPLIHMNAALASRGHLLFLTMLFNFCHWSGGDFDTLNEKMPGLLTLAFNDTLKNAGQLGMTDTTPLDGQTVVLVGWSPGLGRIVGREFEQESRATGFTAKDIKPHHIAPWDPSLSKFADPKNYADMVRFARAQVRLMHDKAPGAAAGGNFIITQITRQGMMISPACDLGSQGTDHGH